MKLQSAFEYLLTYSWAIMAAGILMALLFYFTLTSGTTLPSTCTLPTVGITCQDVVVGSNSVVSIMAFVFTNSQSSSVIAPQLILNMSSMMTQGICKPYYVQQGGSMICNVTIPTSTQPGSLVTGNLHLSVIPCTSGVVSTCVKFQRQTYIGNFNTYASNLPANTPIAVTVLVQNPSQAANGAKDKITANARLYGLPVQGATVNFTVSNSVFSISPQIATSDSNGDTLTYVSSLSAGTVTVTAGFANVFANVMVSFT